jgi:FkbM family methyltransferase
MKTYSQNKEDIAVLNYFGKDFKGLLLDIGANDGITLSNSRLLIESEWSAYLIEPSPKAFNKLMVNLIGNSENTVPLNFAIGTENGKATLYESNEHLTKNDIALLSSLNEAETKRWKNQKFKGVEVDVLTFESFLFLFEEIANIDFISIDAEGLDLDILKQINLTDLNVKCLCIGHNSNKQVRAEIIEYCLQHGLNNILLENSENIILVK